jgi:uncharacterized protein with PIN domain
MSRILKAYETQFRWLLLQVGARRVDQGTQTLVDRAKRLNATEHLSLSEALTRIYQELAARPGYQRNISTPQDIHFFCDAGLGGLARWLRAAGYEAEWEAGIDDDELLEKAAAISATIVTTDSMLMERKVLRDRIIPALWLPPTLSIREQLNLVFRELRLKVRGTRCMTCGGALVRGNKESLRERIPPKTYLWQDEYFVCTRCGKLFWHGTHWRRITRTLEQLEEN